jgi:hypothetical protein
MSLWGKIGKALGGGGMSVIEKGADIVERWAPGVEKKHEISMEIDKVINDSVAAARAHDVGHVGNTMLNDIANFTNRMIRPTVTFGLLGGLWGWWSLPTTQMVEPIVLGWVEIVLVFWFGGRMMLKDLPAAILYLKQGWK